MTSSTLLSEPASSPCLAAQEMAPAQAAPADARLREIFSLARTLFATGPKELALVLVSILAVALTESLGILLLVPLLGLLGLDTTGRFSSSVTELVSGPLRLVGVKPTLPAVLGLYIIIVGARSLVQWYEAVAGERLVQRFMQDLRSRLYRGIVRIPWVDFVRCRSSDFTHALTNEIERAGVAVSLLLRLMVDFVFGLVYVGLAVMFSPRLTVVAFGLGLILLISLRGWNARVRAQGKRLSGLWSEMHSVMGADLRGMKTIRSYGAEDRSATYVDDLSRDVTRTHIKTRGAHASASALFAVGSAVILAVVVLLAVRSWPLASGLVLVLVYLYARLVPRFAALQEDYRRLIGDLPAFSGVLNLIAWCEHRLRPLPLEATPVDLETEIRLHDVSFAYGERAVLEGINLTVPARTTVAIVGRSGSGKTTLADLVSGLLEPVEGQVLIDGKALTPERARNWRPRISYVTQDAFLLHDTIRANLLWARPDASEEDLSNALLSAGAAASGSSIRLALDTVVGDQGTLLSGGERQRVALARAILRQPLLLILDEPTSALDFESERTILDTIRELRGKMTILLITHRLHAVREADVVHVLDEGSIVESGSWEELVKRPCIQLPAFDEVGRRELSKSGYEPFEPVHFKQ